MANQNIARLGVVLGIDTAEFSVGVEKAIQSTKLLNKSIARESQNAAKEIVALEYAIKDYGREVTKAELIQREFITGGKYANAKQGMKDLLLERAKAFDALAASASHAEKAIGKNSAGMDRYLKQALAYQTTDIVTSLAGGQNPLMVMLQQGGQLRDQFGGFGPLFRGIASSVTLMGTAMVAAAASVGVLGFAMYKGWAESNQFRDSLILTNYHAGITASGFEKLSASLSNKLNISIGKSKDIYRELISSGAVASGNMELFAEVVGKVSKLSGESGDKVAQQLIPALDGSASSAQRLNEKYHFLTLAQYKQIEAMEKSGNKQGAIKTMFEAMDSNIDMQGRKLGTLEKAWEGTANAISKAWDALKGFGAENDAQDLAKIDKKLKSLKEGGISLSFGGSEEALLAKRAEILKRQQAEEDKIKKAAKLAEEQDQIDKYKKAGGLDKAMSYEAEYKKLKEDEVFQRKMFNATEFERIQLESNKRIVEKKVALEEAGYKEIGQFGGMHAKIMAQFRKNEELKVSQEIQKINREEYKAVSERQTVEKNDLDMQKQKLGIYQENFFITQSEAKIAEQRLETQQKIAKILADEKLTSEAKSELVKKQEEIGKVKEDLISFEDRLQSVRDMNNAVFSSMTSAIEAFVLTGKFSFADFTKSILASFVKIQAQWLALSMMRGLGSVFGSAFRGFFGGVGQNLEGMSPDTLAQAGLATGGIANAGMPYMVGENGPELFIPKGTGTVIPNQRMNDYGSGGGTNITNNYINAIDTKSFEDRLLGSHNAVWAANQYANKSLQVSGSRT